MTRRIAPPPVTHPMTGSGGRHDNYGFALTAQPGESQRRPATNTSSQLIASACPHHRAPGASVPDGRTIRCDLQNRSRTSAPQISYRLRTRSNGCMRSSNAGSRPRPSCLQQRLPPCCSGRCSPPVRSTCARSMAGRRSPQGPSISQLTSPLNSITSCRWRLRHVEFQQKARRHPRPNDITHLWELVGDRQRGARSRANRSGL